MANVKITDLPSATTPLAGTEVFEVVQSGSSAKVAASAIANTFSDTLNVARGGTGAPTLTGYVKGSGTSAFTASATIPFADLAGRAFITTYSTADQTGNIAAATAVTFNTATSGTGISVVASSQITFTAAGTYMLAPRIQLLNTNAADMDVTFWFRKNGTDIVASATKITVAKTGDGGSGFYQGMWFETVTAGQYVELMWVPENVAVTLDYTVAGGLFPIIPSAVFTAERVA
jgi:hypothetical protein